MRKATVIAFIFCALALSALCADTDYKLVRIEALTNAVVEAAAFTEIEASEFLAVVAAFVEVFAEDACFAGAAAAVVAVSCCAAALAEAPVVVATLDGYSRAPLLPEKCAEAKPPTTAMPCEANPLNAPLEVIA